MGLDVGVVKIESMDTPRQPVSGFLSELAGEDLPEGWSGGWEGNAFLQIYQEDLERRARNYASERGLSQDDSEKLGAWVKGLSWEGHVIMLYLNW